MKMKHTIIVLALTVSAMAQKPTIVASFLPKPGSPNMRLFEQIILPHVGAVMERYDWAELEPSQGSYDFSRMDADIANWQSKGKKTALIISLVSDTINTTRENVATPGWVLSQVPTETCPFISPNKVPVMYDPKMMALTQSFILAALKHLDTKAPWILYDRTGFWRGGENTPLCKGSKTVDTAVNYVRNMAEFVHKNHPDGTRFVSSCSGWPRTNYPEQLCKVFEANDIGIGIQMLSAEDKANFESGRPCAGNWCENFKAHPSAYKYLQPEVKQPPANLLEYFPFAESFGVNAVELRVTDLRIAYSPADPNYAEYGARYQAVLGK
jgi:hypothetical protein